MGFIKLDEEQEREILFGRITSSAMFNDCQTNISPSLFIEKNEASIIKAVINFKLQRNKGLHHTMSTETRVWCGSRRMKRKFGYYWFFVKPFSQLIRRLMLKEIKIQLSKPASKK